MIVLTGTLRCRNGDEAERVRGLLPAHIRLTRAEQGCLTFEVHQNDDPLVWSVEERFVDRPAFDAHQARVKASDWGKATLGIPREYEIRET